MSIIRENIDIDVDISSMSYYITCRIDGNYSFKGEIRGDKKISTITEFKH